MKNKTTFQVKAEINEVYAVTEIKQTYTNHLDAPVELSISFPILSDTQLTKFEVMVGDKKIISKIKEKDKAKEYYFDAISSGNAAIYSEIGILELCHKVTIGNVLAGEIVKLTSEYTQIIKSNDLSYQYTMIQHFPKFLDEKLISIGQPHKLLGIFTINTINPLTRLAIKNENNHYSYNKKMNKNFTKVEISISEEKEEKIGDLYPYLTIFFRTKDYPNPILYGQYDPINDETSYIFHYPYEPSIIPHMDILDEEDKVNYSFKYQQRTNSDNPALFIFLVDQSGSMMGKPIELVKKSLLFFIQSLPKDSYFQLIGFGSSFKKYNEKPVLYNKKNVKNITQVINGLSADLGGTEILKPLEDIYDSNYLDIKLPKNIFLLTDGEVNNKDKCYQIIEKNSEKFKVHSIGLGSSFDKELISRCGLFGKGSYAFVPEVSKINEVIIESLSKCFRKNIINASIKIKEIQADYLYYQKDNQIYQDEVFTSSFMTKGKPIQQKIDIELIATDPLNLNEIKQNITIEKPLLLEEGNKMSKIVIGNILKGIIDEKEEVVLSKKYQIPSKGTALFGESENDVNIEQPVQVQEMNPNSLKIMQLFSQMNLYKKQSSNFDKELSCGSPKLGALPKCYAKKSSGSGGFFSFFSNLFKSKPKKEKETLKVEEVKHSNTENKSYIINNFDQLILQQDVIEGYWEENSLFNTLLSSNEMKNVYKKAKDYIYKIGELSKNLQSKILATFIVIYYILTVATEKIAETRLIVEKGRKFLESNKMEYSSICEKIK